MGHTAFSPQGKAQREADLVRMREKFRRHPPRSQRRTVISQETITVRRVIRPHSWKPQELAHAIRIAAKIASQERTPNPLFIQALEIAATYFDDL